jgi:hypothetical protein
MATCAVGPADVGIVGVAAILWMGRSRFAGFVSDGLPIFGIIDGGLI